MIDNISRRLAISIVNAAPGQTSSVTVLTYYIAVTLNLLAVIVLSIAVGGILGTVVDTLIALLSFVVLRMFSGGYHLRSLDLCVVVTVAIVTAIPMIPLTEGGTIISSIIAAIIVLILAPNNVYDQSLVTTKLFPWLKGISVMIALSNIFIQSPVVAMAFLVQGILLIPKGEVMNK